MPLVRPHGAHILSSKRALARSPDRCARQSEQALQRAWPRPGNNELSNADMFITYASADQSDRRQIVPVRRVNYSVRVCRALVGMSAARRDQRCASRPLDFADCDTQEAAGPLPRPSRFSAVMVAVRGMRKQS